MSALTDLTNYTALTPASSRPESGGIGLLLAGIAVAVFILLALLIQIGLRRNYRFNLFFGLLSLLFSAGAMVLCLLGLSLGTLVAQPTGDPQETVTAFFDALCAGNYQEACGFLNGATDLGLGGPAADPVGQAMYDALEASYAYELYGDCTVDQLSAHQEVLFTYLDLTSIGEDVKETTMEVLGEFVRERDRDELYDENENYLPQVAQEAYAAAVERVLTQAERYTKTTGVQLELSYTGGKWLLNPDRSLLNAITGGAA